MRIALLARVRALEERLVAIEARIEALIERVLALRAHPRPRRRRKESR